MRGHEHLPPAAICTFALRLFDGRFVADPGGMTATFSLDEAYVWLWRLGESDDVRAARIAAIVERYSWIGRAVAVRAR